MKKSNVVLENFVEYNSGLGNQLFQLNYAHFLKNRFEKEFGMLRRKVPSRIDRPFDLDELLQFESTFPLPEIIDTHAIFRKRLGRIPYVRKFMYSNERSINWISEPREFSFAKPTSPAAGKKNYYVGYFQNYEYVEEAYKFYAATLENFLSVKFYQAKSRLDYIEGKGILHIRRGDLLKPECSGMGMLNFQYYREAMIKLDIDPHRAVILTDDKSNVVRLASQLGIDYIIGPDEMSAWEALAVFAQSPQLVSANSTLSWWGAFIGKNNGNIAAYPSIWFQKWSPNPADSLHIPGQIMQESYFE